MAAFNPKIKEGKYANGTPFWHFNLTLPNGKRHRKKYPTYQNALNEKTRLIRQFSGGGSNILNYQEIESALLHLNTTANSSARGKNISFVVNWFCENYRDDSGILTISEYIEIYKEERERGKKSLKTIKEDKIYLNHFDKHFGRKKPTEISRKNLKEYINYNTCEYHRHKVLKAFYSWLRNEPNQMDQYFDDPVIEKSPFEGWKAPSLKRKNPPLIVEPCQVVPLLKEANKQKCLTWFVWGLFTGMRPESEMIPFWRNPDYGWRKVDLERGYILVDDKIEKTKTRVREIVIQPNLLDWINLFQKEPDKYLMYPKNLKRKFLSVKKTILEPTQAVESDIMRHSFISYFFQLEDKLQDLCFQCATSPKMVTKHYFKRVNKQNAKDFFSISPKDII